MEKPISTGYDSQCMLWLAHVHAVPWEAITLVHFFHKYHKKKIENTFVTACISSTFNYNKLQEVPLKPVSKEDFCSYL